MKKESPFSRKRDLKDLFLEPSPPNKNRRKLKFSVLCAFIGVFGALIIYILVQLFSTEDRRIEKSPLAVDPIPKKDSLPQAAAPDTTSRSFYASPGEGFSVFGYSAKTGHSGTREGQAQRNLQASAWVKESSGKANAGSFPESTVLSGVLQGRVVSGRAPVPVAVLLRQETVSELDSAVIPEGSKFLGTGIIDEETERLIVNFTTLLFPDGSRFQVQAVGLMPDGSHGLSGDFESGALKKDAGRILGSLAQGFAEGMKTRTTGPFGTTSEAGSVRNGVLNGISQATGQHVQDISNDLGNTKAKITVPEQTPLLIYFERDFSP